MCVRLLFYDLSPIIGCVGLVRTFSGEPGHVHICCVSFRCVECRAGTSTSGHSAGVSAGTVRIFCFLGSVLASTVRLKWWGGCCVFSFNYLQFCHFSWRVNMRGRDFVLYYTWYSAVAPCGFFYTSC